MDDCVKRDIVWISETDEEVAPSTLALYQASDQQEARLDWHKLPPNSAYELCSGEKLSGPSFTLYLVDQIKNVEELSGEKHILPRYPTKFILKLVLIDVTRRPVILCFQQKESLKSWSEALKTALEAGRKHRKKTEQKFRDTLKQKGKCKEEEVYSACNRAETVTFGVDVDSTSASIRNDIVGSGTLLFSKNHITLYNKERNYSICWHYNHIRRFGYTSTTFTLEGGKKSGVKGNGLFIFRNCPGQDIRKCIENNVKLLTQKKVNAELNNCGNNSDSSDADYELNQNFEKNPALIDFYATAANLPRHPSTENDFPFLEQPPKVPPKNFNPNFNPKPQNKTPDIVKVAEAPKMSRVVQKLSSMTPGYEEASTYSALSFDKIGQINNDNEISSPSGNIYGEALCQQKNFGYEEQAYSEVDCKAAKRKYK